MEDVKWRWWLYGRKCIYNVTVWKIFTYLMEEKCLQTFFSSTFFYAPTFLYHWMWITRIREKNYLIRLCLRKTFFVRVSTQRLGGKSQHNGEALCMFARQCGTNIAIFICQTWFFFFSYLYGFHANPFDFEDDVFLISSRKVKRFWVVL